MKFDPKLLKKINQSTLIQASKLIGIKNAEKVAKESLIPAFIKAVEAVPEKDQEGLDAVVINAYNEIVKTLGLDQDVEPVVETTAPKLAAKATKPAIVAKIPKIKVKKETNKKEFSRCEAVGEVLKKTKAGLVSELIQKSDALYVEKGGQSNEKESRAQVNKILPALSAMGVLEINEDKYKRI